MHSIVFIWYLLSRKWLNTLMHLRQYFVRTRVKVFKSINALFDRQSERSLLPSFFKEMYIDNLRSGISYVDGELRYNNSVEVALKEAAKIRPTAKHFCLINIETRRWKTVQIVNDSRASNDDKNVNIEHSLFEQVKSFALSLVSFMPGWKTATNFSNDVLVLLKIAGALSKLVTDSENTHRRLKHAARFIDVDKRFSYFRFNIERDVSDIGLEEWSR